MRTRMPHSTLLIIHEEHKRAPACNRTLSGLTGTYANCVLQPNALFNQTGFGGRAAYRQRVRARGPALRDMPEPCRLLGLLQRVAACGTHRGVDDGHR